MSLADWDKHPNGDIKVFPLTGLSTATFMNGMSGGLRLEFALEPTLKDIAAVQLVLTPVQIEGLLAALARMRERMKVEGEAHKREAGPAN
jgi:hypothetical protein